MNAKQLEIISKPFNVTEDFNLTRAEFEYFPCPMVACLWTDEQMEELADKVKKEFVYERFSTELEELENEWYRVIEKCAIEMGMKYYEDLSKEELEEVKNKWENIK